MVKQLVKPKKEASETNPKKSEVSAGTVEPTSQSSDDTKKEYDTLCAKISAEISQVEKCYFTIAEKIYIIKKLRLFEIENYANIYTFVADKFQLSRGTCSNYITICRNFYDFDSTKKPYLKRKSEYKEFSPSQLLVIVKAPLELRSKLKPEMSVREMKQMIRAIDKDEPQSEPQPVIEMPEKTQRLITQNSNAISEKYSTPNSESIELVSTDDINKIIGEENQKLFERIKQFKEEHPDTKFTLIVSLNYEKIPPTEDD